MRDDGEFFKSIRDVAQVRLVFWASIPTWLGEIYCCLHAYLGCCFRGNMLLRKSLENLANRTLQKPEHYGIHSEVLIVCGHFSYLLYRYLIKTE